MSYIKAEFLISDVVFWVSMPEATLSFTFTLLVFCASIKGVESKFMLVDSLPDSSVFIDVMLQFGDDASM